MELTSIIEIEESEKLSLSQVQTKTFVLWFHSFLMIIQSGV